MSLRLSPVLFILVGLFLAAPLTIHAQALSRTEALRNLDSQIEQQKQKADEAQKTLDDAIQRGDSSSSNTADAALQAAKAIIDSLLKQKKQVTAPLVDANQQCQPVIKECGCNQRKVCGWGVCQCVGRPNMYLCTCFQKINTDQFAVGICKDTLKCEGQSYTNLEGKSTGVGDIGGIVGQIFKGILDKVMGGGGAGGGAGGTGYQGCTQYYQVTVPSTDPCAQYVPPTSSSLLDTNIGQNNASDLLLNALQGGTQSSLGTNLGTDVEQNTTPVSVSGNILNLIKTNTQPKGATSSATSTSFSSIFGEQAVHLQSGTQGNIVITGTGATVVANSRDPQTNSEVAGFYGSDTFGNSQPQGLVAQMCQSRPWASSVVSFLIPPAFFDSLCAWRGYQVGVSQVAPAPQLQTPSGTAVQQNTITPAPTPVSTIAPSVDIWATPATVTLGSRTSIFWNAKGVISCTETSPSGNFSQNTFSGGASTVPLSGATTFVISCLTADGKTVTDSVTVNLAI